MMPNIFKFEIGKGEAPKDVKLEMPVFDRSKHLGYFADVDKLFAEIEAELARRMDAAIAEVQAEWREAIKDPDRAVVVMTDEPD
jgi:hypothetical protein